jgi:hypothetical protein
MAGISILHWYTLYFDHFIKGVEWLAYALNWYV